jgi:hypothetical protein
LIGTAGNQISVMLASLPTQIEDPAQRLEALVAALREAKARYADRPAHLLHQVSAAFPQLLHGAATRAVARALRWGPPLFNLFVSNVPGPQVPLYVGGARVLATYPVSVVSDVGGGLNITVMSYDGHMDIGIVICPDVAPDVWELAGHCADALAELIRFATRSATPEPARELAVARTATVLKPAG